jgi:hypothetical protein
MRIMRRVEVALKEFNTEGVCDPDIHYMVNTDDKLMGIKALIDRNKYFVINRPVSLASQLPYICFTRF